MNKTDFVIDDCVHDVGDSSCRFCWESFPRECDCGGLVHGQFLEEDYDGYYLIYKCDKCEYDYTFDDRY